jgi:hypothetical protein
MEGVYTRTASKTEIIHEQLQSQPEIISERLQSQKLFPNGFKARN